MRHCGILSCCSSCPVTNGCLPPRAVSVSLACSRTPGYLLLQWVHRVRPRLGRLLLSQQQNPVAWPAIVRLGQRAARGARWQERGVTQSRTRTQLQQLRLTCGSRRRRPHPSPLL